MRIAQVAPLMESVPPALYGGSERIVSWLTEELVRHGHDVTLFASGDSKTQARFIPICQRALWRHQSCRETLPHHVLLVEEVLRRAAEFDILHFHSDYTHFPSVSRAGVASVTTLHGLAYEPDLGPLARAFPGVPLIAVSDNQRRGLDVSSWCGTVHHGIPADLHHSQGESEGYLVFMGPTSPDKEIELAIEIAEAARTPLKIAAKIYEEDQCYFQQRVEPLLARSSFAEFLGEVGGRRKDDLLGRAKALLFPIQWEEPFGLVMIEALACGTPVIAWNRGAVPALIQDGVHGFIVNDVTGALTAIQRLGEIDRHLCRAHFDSRFQVVRMAGQYLKLYQAQIEGKR